MELNHQLKYRLDKRKYLYLFLDLEGTIIPNSEKHLKPRPRQQIVKALDNLQNINKVSVNLISENSAVDARNLIDVHRFNYVGYFGGEILKNGSSDFLINPAIYKKLFKDIHKQYQIYFSQMTGVSYRETPFYVSIDFSKNYSPSFYHALNLWIEEIFPKIIRYRLMPVFYHNHKLIIKPAKLKKMMAIHKILEEKDLHKSLIIYVGDNFMDEEIFILLKDKGITVRVDNYPAKTKAHYHFRSDIELIQFLNMVCDFYY